MDGIDLLVKTAMVVLGNDEIMDLGDRLDGFYDVSKVACRQIETVKDSTDRQHTIVSPPLAIVCACAAAHGGS